MKIKMTEAFVRGAQPDGQGVNIKGYQDAVEPTLWLRVFAPRRDGRRSEALKTFRFRCSVRGRDVYETLGAFPALSLSDARKQAAALKVRFRDDPDWKDKERAAEAEAKARRAFKIDELIVSFLDYKQRHIAASTLALYRHRLTKHVAPQFGSYSIEDLNRSDVRDLVAAIGAKGNERTANYVKQLIGQMFAYAQNELERECGNPAAGMKGYKEAARQRALTDEEIRAVWTALDDPERPPGPVTAIALKICLFSAQRVGEIIGMRDDELDFAERVWRVPGERTKSGRPNLVPITPRLIGFIQQAQALRAPCGGKRPVNAPVFPMDLERRHATAKNRTLSPAQPNSSMTRHACSQGMARLCADLKIPAATAHDLRRTARTLLERERLGVPYEHAERLLSHMTGSSLSRTYNVHQYSQEKRRALEKMDAELDRIIAARPVEMPDNVVPLEDRRTAGASQ